MNELADVSQFNVKQTNYYSKHKHIILQKFLLSITMHSE